MKIIGKSEVWKHRSLELWKHQPFCGNISPWKHRTLEPLVLLWKHQPLETSVPGNIGPFVKTLVHGNISLPP